MITKRPFVLALLVALVLVLGGCVGYYGQAVRGHMKPVLYFPAGS
jgi:hypothetical protein